MDNACTCHKCQPTSPCYATEGTLLSTHTDSRLRGAIDRLDFNYETRCSEEDEDTDPCDTCRPCSLRIVLDAARESEGWRRHAVTAERARVLALAVQIGRLSVNAEAQLRAAVEAQP